LRATEGGRRVREVVLLNIPLIGPILRRNLTSRWCDVAGLGVEAGLDLPAAVDLADDAIASPGLKKDGKAIMEAVESGRKIGSVGAMKILPPIVPAAIELGSERSDLPQTLRSASQIYQQQAEQKLALVPAVLTPILVIGIGVLVGVVMTSLFLPLFSLFRIY
jgi:type II secretory pathway component PulF